MTTDTKNVARWNLGFKGLSDRAAMLEHHKGHYILFTDHERVVGELKDHIRLSAISALELDAQNRKELAASRAEVEGLRKLLGETAQCLADVSNDVGGWAVEEVIESSMNAAMEKGNDPAKA